MDDLTSDSPKGHDQDLVRLRLLYRNYAVLEVFNFDHIDDARFEFFAHIFECLNQMMFRSLKSPATTTRVMC